MKTLWKKMMVAGLLAGLAAGAAQAEEMVLDCQGGWELVQSEEGNTAALFLVRRSDGERIQLSSLEVPTATVTNSYWDEYAGWDEAAGRAVGGMVERVDTVAAEYRFRAFVDDGRVYWEDWADGKARRWTASCRSPEDKTMLAEAPVGASDHASRRRGGGKSAAKAISQTLVFNANGGQFEDGSQVVDDWDWAIFASNEDTYEFWYTDDFQHPFRSGHAFDGWYSAATGGTPVKDGDPVTSASRRTLYAHWVSTNGTSLAEATDCGKLTFATEGDVPWFGQKSESHDGTDAARSGQLAPDHAWHGSSAMSASVNGPGTISFWWKADGLFAQYDSRRSTALEFLVDGTVRASLKTSPADWTQVSFGIGEGTHVLKWEYHGGGELWRSYYRGLDCGFVDQIVWKPTQTVTFDANGGSCGTKTAYYQPGATYGSLPVATREGHVFVGWFTAASGGAQVKAGDTVPDLEARTLYAHWKPTQTVTFDANGGSCGTATAVYPLGEPYGSLPTAARGEDIFLGWFTDAGVLVTAESPVEGGARLILHARWVKAVDGVGIAVTSVRQRFPWNGLVDIDYEVFCEDPDTEVWVVPEATDGEHGRALVMATLSGDGATGRIKAGRHRMTWDAKADNPGAHSSALTVKMKGAQSALQTISFAAIGAQLATDRVTLSATATSGLAVTFEVVSGPGVVTGNELTFTGAGTVEVSAVQAGDERWLPATATQTVAVARVVQTIDFAAIGTQTPADRVTLSATATSGLAVTFEVVSGPGVVTGNVLTFTGEGTVEVRAVQAGDERWLPATATQTVAVEKAYLYLVVDLSAGADAASYPITRLDAPPSGGFNTDEYKTTKLVMRRIEPGTFTMGNEEKENNLPHQVTLTKTYYIGVFEVTQKQYELVTGSNPVPEWYEEVLGEKKPIGYVSWNAIRGDTNWPASSAVSETSFMGRLRARTGLIFDLPTEAQWEYACRAGTMTRFSYGDNENGDYMWDEANSSDSDWALDVGMKLPNSWGLYDMHGNLFEWCLDWWSDSLGTTAVTDPKGAPEGLNGSVWDRRVARGGSIYSSAGYCTSSHRGGNVPWMSEINDVGFRLMGKLSE